MQYALYDLLTLMVSSHDNSKCALGFVQKNYICFDFRVNECCGDFMLYGVGFGAGVFALHVTAAIYQSFQRMQYRYVCSTGLLIR